MRKIHIALFAAMLFSPNLYEKPVFAQERVPLELKDVDVLRFVGSGEGDTRSFVYAMPSQKMEKGTFLGVTTSNVPAALREQMSLPKGFGLVVETLEKDGPAAVAGIQKYDILQKLNDQLLVNQPQLQVLVRSMKPGESVAITLLRKGQPVTVNAILVEKDVPELSTETFEAPLPGLAPHIMQWKGVGDPRAIVGRMRVSDRNANIVSSDGDMTLELKTTDGSKHLKVTDKEGKVTFDGPIDTPEQRSKLPENVSERINSLESKFNKITVRVNAKATDGTEAPPVEEEKK